MPLQLPSLPPNTKPMRAAIARPFTLFAAVGLSIAAFALSIFFFFTNLKPPTLECPSESPRTRRRPSSPAKTIKRRSSVLDLLPSFPRRRRLPASPPLAIRLKNHHGHDLALVGEEEEEEEAEEEDSHREEEAAESEMESLIPDIGSETASLSEVETVEDGAMIAPGSEKGKGKATGFFRRSSRKSSSRTSSSSSEPPIPSPSSDDTDTRKSRKGLSIAICAQKRAAQRRRTLSPTPSVASGSSSPLRPSSPTEMSSLSSFAAATGPISRPTIISSLTSPPRLQTIEPLSFQHLSPSPPLTPSPNSSTSSKGVFTFFGRRSTPEPLLSPTQEKDNSPAPPMARNPRPARAQTWTQGGRGIDGSGNSVLDLSYFS